MDAMGIDAALTLSGMHDFTATGAHPDWANQEGKLTVPNRASPHGTSEFFSSTAPKYGALASANTSCGSCVKDRNCPTSAARLILSGPAISTMPSTGAPSAESVTASATSSDAMGCNKPVDARTWLPFDADFTMPGRNSKNCVE